MENTVQVLHHTVVKFPARLSHVLFFALETAGQIDHTRGGTREQPLEFKWLIAVAGCKSFCFLDLGTDVGWFVTWLHTG